MAQGAVQHPQQTRAAAAVAVAAFGFSWGFIIVKFLGLPPAMIAFYRTWIGALTLLAIVAVKRLPRPRRWGPVFGTGVMFGLHQLLFISGAQHTSIAIVTLVQGAQPLLVALASRRLLGEAVPRTLLGSSLLAIAGVGIVVFANRNHGSHSLLGDVYALANLFAFLGYFLFAKRAREQGTETLPLTAYAFTIAGFVVTPMHLLSGDVVSPLPWQLGLMATHALLPGNGHLLVNWAHPRISAALSSLLLSLVPVMASLWAFLFFEEPYGPQHIAGTLLTLFAIELGRRAAYAQAAARP